MPLVHIVDDDPAVRAATSFLLRSKGYATQIYSSGQEFLNEGRLDQGCVLLDLRMGGIDGLEVQEALNERGVDLPIIMLSGHGDISSAVSAMKLGAVDFLEKPYDESELLASIERALAVASTRSEQDTIRAKAKARLASLSPREQQVLQGLVAGMSNKTIARELELSPRTIEMHRANMMSSLEVGSLSEAVRVAIDAGLDPLPAT